MVKKKGAQPAQLQLAYFTLLSAADRVRGFFDAICAPFDISEQQYNVLRILRSAEPAGLPTLTIAERLVERTPGITRMIDRLARNGLVVREHGMTDRRCVYCRITKKGLQLLAQLDEPIAAAYHTAFGALTSVELSELIALLLKTRKVHEPAGD